MENINALGRLKFAKVQVMLLLLLVAGLAIYMADGWVERSSPETSELARTEVVPGGNKVPSNRGTTREVWLEFSKPLADACLIAAFLGFTYEWKVRQEAEEDLKTLFREELLLHKKEMSLSFHKAMEGATVKLNDALRSTIHTIPISSEEDWFERLQASITSAKIRVDLTYLDSKPPSQVKGERAAAYFKAMERLVPDKQEVAFRRVIRATKSMIPRIEELIASETGKYNSSLACYVTSDPESDNTDAIQIQLIDNDNTFLGSIGTEKLGQTIPKDMFVCSKEFSNLWSRYYEQLWGRSVVIVDRGVYQDRAWVRVSKRLGK